MNDLSKNIPSLEYFDDNETIDLLTNRIVNNISAFVFIFDAELKVPIWINHYFLDRMGYTKDDMHSTTPEGFLALFHPVSRDSFVRRIKNYDDAGGVEIKTIYQLKKKDNTWIHLLTSTKVCKRNLDGKIKYLMGYAVEINPKELKDQLSMIRNLDQHDSTIDLISDLSSRELHIIRLITNGLSDKEIANRLNISIHTTKTHRKRIIHKLGLKKSAALIKFAVENGLG